MKLPLSYYLDNNVVKIAKELLGKEIFTNFEGAITSGIISETEAYEGISDKASHAFNGRRTQRTETMFLEGGRSYVYLCYGIHHLVNIVSATSNIPNAILLRAIIPKEGRDLMQVRTGKTSLWNIANGPGKFSKSMGIKMIHNNISLIGDKIWIEDRDIDTSKYQIETSKRIGIEYAEEDALLPYRFELKKIEMNF
jgi:DNA-3-methyladenine glycosylase